MYIPDIDECTSSKPCEQECKNTVGSYTCSCKNGFVINNKDATKCTSKIKNVKITRLVIST